MLFLVATPLGNLKDITLRALDILQDVDIIACEDTRNSRKLLAPYGIEKSLLCYHDHNASKVRPRLLKLLEDGKKIAYITDGGMPLISDPGFKLILSCQKSNIPYTVIPGPSAPLTALCLSGLSPAQFYFGGFLSSKSSSRLKALTELSSYVSTLIFFESAKRLVSFLTDALTALGDRDAAICREMTKLYEETRKGSLSSLIKHYTLSPARGEIVIVIAGSPPLSPPSSEDLDACLTKALSHYTLKEAVDIISQDFNLSKRNVYQRALTLKKSHSPKGLEKGP